MAGDGRGWWKEEEGGGARIEEEEEEGGGGSMRKHGARRPAPPCPSVCACPPAARRVAFGLKRLLTPVLLFVIRHTLLRFESRREPKPSEENSKDKTMRGCACWNGGGTRLPRTGSVLLSMLKTNTPNSYQRPPAWGYEP
eukprot:256806-Rhodomonas_salina.1